MRPHALRFIGMVGLLLLGTVLGPGRAVAVAEGWKAGTARVAITAQAADVDGPAMGAPGPGRPKGRCTDLWAKALVARRPVGAKGRARHARRLRHRPRELSLRVRKALGVSALA